MPEDLPTRILGERAQNGDKDALNLLLGRYQARVRAEVRKKLGDKLRERMESSDIVQEVLVRVLPRVAVINFSNEAAFMQYLKQIVIHTICDLSDRETADKRDMDRVVSLNIERSRGGQHPFEPVGPGLSATPSKVVIRKEQEGRVRAAMERLGQQSPEYRELIDAVVYNGRTYVEIGAERGLSPDAVRMRVARAKATLALIYKDLDKDS